MAKIDRHKVFISYYHKDDQDYKNYLVDSNRYYYYDIEKRKYISPFDDYSVGFGDIDDEGMSSEQIRRIIRDDYISDASVLILLCGENTRFRKHIDWEIHTAMYDSDNNSQMGIVVINLPSIKGKQYVRVSDDSEKSIVSTSGNWVTLNTREEFENAYPYMPSRIIDNLVKHNPITVIDWDRIVNNPEKLMVLIDNAFKRKDDIKYDHSVPLRRRNS